jgi:aspartate/methionine/tyrosine aminotransferase
MFSRRTPRSLAPNRLSDALARRHRQGLPVLDLTRSNPTQCGIELPSEAILAALGDPRVLSYEPEPRGWRGAREAVAAHHAGQGAPVDPERLFLAASTSEAYSWAFKLLCDPGDEVLVPCPSYPLFECLGALDGVAVRHYPLLPELDWAIGRDELEARINPRTRAILLVNPNNPTGSFVHREDWLYLTDLAARRRLAIVSDEVFFDYLLDSSARPVSALAIESEALVLTLSGLSKIAALPQMKLGWMHVGGPSALVAEAGERMEWIADAYLPVSAPVLYAAPQWLALASQARLAVLERCRAVQATFEEACAGASVVRPRRVEGGWSLVLEGPRSPAAADLALQLIEKDGVLIQPGHYYDFANEGFVVTSLLTPPMEACAGATALHRSWTGPSEF